METQVTARSLKILLLFLNLSWWTTLIGGGLLLLIVIVIPFTDRDATVERSFRAEVNLKDTSAFQVKSTSGEAGSIEFKEPILAKITLPETRRTQSTEDWILIPIVAFALGISLWFIHLLRQICRSVRDGEPFTLINAKRIRLLALALFLGTVLGDNLQSLFRMFAARGVQPDGFTFSASFGIGGEILFLVLILMVLSEVFRLGARMQEDQKLTI